MLTVWALSKELYMSKKYQVCLNHAAQAFFFFFFELKYFWNDTFLTSLRFDSQLDGISSQLPQTPETHSILNQVHDSSAHD